MLREAVDEAEIHYSLEINVPPCLSICMVLSSISYRSRWAYNSNAFLSSASRRQKQGGKYEETSYEDPDKDEVIVSRNGTGAVGRPKRKLRKS